MEKKKAIELVIEYEKKQGRNPETTNKFKEGFDIKSNDRFIDVKIVNRDDDDILLSFTKFKKLGKNVSNYYVYVVAGEEKPSLIILEPDFLMKNLNLLTLINIKSGLLRRLPKTSLQ